jgi:hypothetical protein
MLCVTSLAQRDNKPQWTLVRESQMKIIDAVWDNEVLGVKSVEVRCDASDSLDSLLRCLKDLENSHEYIVVKSPVSNRDVIEHIPEIGFKFIETMISVERSVKANTIEGRLAKRSEGLITREATEDEISHVFEQIMMGIFSTDRISLDENFGPTLGAKRYCNWIESEISLGGSVYSVALASGTKLGFFTLRVTEEGIAHSVLSGLFDAASTPGFGLVLLSLILRTAEKNGAKKIVSAISSNNLPVVRTHVQLGFEIRDMSYVYVRHSS